MGDEEGRDGALPQSDNKKRAGTEVLWEFDSFAGLISALKCSSDESSYRSS